MFGWYYVHMKRNTLFFLGIILLVFGINNPMFFIWPLWIFVALYRKQISSLISPLSLPLAFIGSGVLFGLLIETFAILNNLPLPASERILLSPDPFTDLFLGFFYYFFVVTTWYLLLRKISFSKTDVFVLTGLLGVATEQGGAILFGVFTTPLGIPLALLIAVVYALFPFLAYLVTEERFGTARTLRKIWHYPLAALALFVQWAIFGLFVLPFLKSLL